MKIQNNVTESVTVIHAAVHSPAACGKVVGHLYMARDDFSTGAQSAGLWAGVCVTKS